METKKKIIGASLVAAVVFAGIPASSALAWGLKHDVKCYGVCKAKDNKHCEGKDQGYKMMSEKSCKRHKGTTEEPKTETTTKTETK